MKHPAIRYAVAIAIAAAALYLAFHKQHLGRLAHELEGANILIILAGTAVMFLSHLVRAWRYKMFLRPLAPHTRLWSAFRALIAGYAANNVIPRSGDIIRPLIFSKRENIPVATSVAVLLIERLTDLIGLTAILILSILLFGDQIELQFPSLEAVQWSVLGLLFAIFSFAILILFSERKTKAVIHWLSRGLPKRFRSAVESGAAHIEEGLKGVRQGSALPVIAGTVGISLFYTLSMYISTFAIRGSHIQSVGLGGCFLLQSDRKSTRLNS